MILTMRWWLGQGRVGMCAHNTLSEVLVEAVHTATSVPIHI
jgi:hypothetical protein